MKHVGDISPAFGGILPEFPDLLGHVIHGPNMGLPPERKVHPQKHSVWSSFSNWDKQLPLFYTVDYIQENIASFLVTG